jgi:nucleotide-binding universal stress UspA family protein
LECGDQNIPFEWLSFEGDPIEKLQNAAASQDLLISGYDMSFHGDVRKQLSGLVAKLLMSFPRPIVVCPDKLDNTGELLIGYDGSPPAMRAIQIFALLGIGRDKNVRVMSVDKDRQKAARTCSECARYLRIHDYEVDEHPIVTTSAAPDVLRSEVTKRKVGTLIMGAYGNRGLKTLLFGSTTKALVEDPPCALFVYH